MNGSLCEWENNWENWTEICTEKFHWVFFGCVSLCIDVLVIRIWHRVFMGLFVNPLFVYIWYVRTYARWYVMYLYLSLCSLCIWWFFVYVRAGVNPFTVCMRALSTAYACEFECECEKCTFISIETGLRSTNVSLLGFYNSLVLTPRTPLHMPRRTEYAFVLRNGKKQSKATHKRVREKNKAIKLNT